MPAPVDRRDWLDPKNLGQAVGQALGMAHSLGVELAPAPTPSAGPELALVRFRHAAMATQFELVLPFGHGVGLELAAAAFAEIDQVEEQLTVYRADSAVSTINRDAAHSDTAVAPELFELLQRAVSLHRMTDGAFDIAMGALIAAWGFFRGPPRVPTSEEHQSALASSGTPWIELNPNRRTIRFLRPGVQLNLASIGKGYALDRVADRLANELRVTAALIHGGRSSVFALGTQPGDERGWPVGISHPWEPGRRLAMVMLRDQGLGTSAGTYKHLVHDGKKLGHLLDPRTGWPAKGIASASALAPSAADADALATAFFVRGPDFAAAFCKQHPEIGAVLLADGEEQIRCFGAAQAGVNVEPA